ncbi:MAG: transcription-repair coupling factor [Bdellovibrionales bacterium]|nr:transcription-repair coupling factor [Bdellovibrionales bacterium]
MSELKNLKIHTQELSHSYLPLGFQTSLARWMKNPQQKLQISGTTSVIVQALAVLQPTVEPLAPNLVILAKDLEVKRFIQAVNFFNPKTPVFELPAFEVEIYSGLFPNRKTIAKRVQWLYQAQNALPGQIFVTTPEALLQKTIPFQTLNQNCIPIQTQRNLPPRFTEKLSELGYTAVPIVEDTGTFAIRGGIVDIFSPAYEMPLRLELFGDTVESMRWFDPESQRSVEDIRTSVLIPATEILTHPEFRIRAAQKLKENFSQRQVSKEEFQPILQSLSQGFYFSGMEYLASYFYEKPSLPLEHFSQPIHIWQGDSFEISRQYDALVASLKVDSFSENLPILPKINEVYALPAFSAKEVDSVSPDSGGFNLAQLIESPPDSKIITFNRLLFNSSTESISEEESLAINTSELKEFTQAAQALTNHSFEFIQFLETKLKDWKDTGHVIFISSATLSQCQRIRFLLERTPFRALIVNETSADWAEWFQDQENEKNLLHIVPRLLPESLRLQSDKLILLRDEDFFGKKRHRNLDKKVEKSSLQHKALSFNDLIPGDLIVHIHHGIGLYEGLKVMSIQGVDSEFIQLKYKDNDRLYLPVFRIHQINKFSGPSLSQPLNKLGGPNWDKVKTKVKNHLRDVAAELLELYAQRSKMSRPPFSKTDNDFYAFEAAFPYDETEDQLKCIQEILKDLTNDKPMDRLICGDVGFGKTEMALRAAFKVVQEQKQVALIAPTTVLTFQHTETFKKRFKDWPINIKTLNRFVPNNEIKDTINNIKKGTVDIVIGTHRLLSRDIEFKNLGLLIIDEEQKFGVLHKEKIRKLKLGIDTLTMTATPIPRTLNQSLMGLRDLSLINTPPADRLPTRTFVSKFDDDIIRKAVSNEVARGGQVFFIHNRIESIYGLADDLRRLLPQIKMAVAHGQMEEHELEKVMIGFFNHEIDMLICTTIVESGMDIPRANTMFIDNAHQLGLSQLYQLRGRVGRAKERAYCYLLVPSHKQIEKDAQERLKVLQENTALGSGIRIAQYDLELRGAGDLLGEEQSGHINSIGYEMYLELLEDAIKESKNEEIIDVNIEPEINVPISALIPDQYISDLRLRLSYYRIMSDIKSSEDIDRIEMDLNDQFGRPPEPVLNLMGLMLIRHLCKQLFIKDLTRGKNGILLLFSEKTPLSTEIVLNLVRRENKKYSLNPDSRIFIRMNEISWLRLHEELTYLISLIK